MAKTPLIFEELSDNSNYIFLTLIEYKGTRYLTIIENVVGQEIHAYVLDKVTAQGLDLKLFMEIALKWFYSNSENYPLSFEFAKLGLSEVTKPVLNVFNVNAISRIIGKLFTYETKPTFKTKKRKLNPISKETKIVQFQR